MYQEKYVTLQENSSPSDCLDEKGKTTCLKGLPLRLIFGPPNRKNPVDATKDIKTTIVVVCMIREYENGRKMNVISLFLYDESTA